MFGLVSGIGTQRPAMKLFGAAWSMEKSTRSQRPSNNGRTDLDIAFGTIKKLLVLY
jgi:hypothetical protein